MTDEKLIEKITKLLAKAEGTDNKAEAEAFTAKATQLMVDNAIDEARLVKEGKSTSDKVVARQFAVKGYAKAKVQLLYNVAKAFGCDMVVNRNTKAGGWTNATGTIVGWESDLDAIMVLFASLQIQVENEAAREVKRNSHVHGRAFKQAFILGFANEVGSRLRAQRAAKVTEAEQAAPGTAVALVDRTAAVERHFAGLFPKTGKSSGASLSNYSGYNSGQAAGKRADIGQSGINGGRKALGS